MHLNVFRLLNALKAKWSLADQNIRQIEFGGAKLIQNLNS